MCVNTAFHPASHIFLVDINELCVSPARIWTSIDFEGSWGNSNMHFLFDIIVPPFGRTTVIVGLLVIFFMVFSWFGVISACRCLCYSCFRF